MILDLFTNFIQLTIQHTTQCQHYKLHTINKMHSFNIPFSLSKNICLTKEFTQVVQINKITKRKGMFHMHGN
jgi:hypothetical protein